jgi:hypothetical protein
MGRAEAAEPLHLARPQVVIRETGGAPTHVTAQLALQPPDGRTIPLLAESETPSLIEITNMRIRAH